MNVGGAGPSLAQTTGEAAFVSEAASKSASRPVEGPGTEVVRRRDVIQQNATQPVEAPGAGTANQPVEAPGAWTANQPVEAPGAWTATQPVEAPGAGSEVLLSNTGSAVQSDSEEDLQSEPGSPAGDNFQYGFPKMIQVTKNFLRKLGTEKPSEV